MYYRCYLRVSSVFEFPLQWSLIRTFCCALSATQGGTYIDAALYIYY